MRLGLFLFILAFTSQLLAQQDYLSSIRIYNTKDGLLSDRIHAIHKDANGFMWIGTEEGLSRFDGQKFMTISNETNPEMSIKSIHKIVEDKEGYLWLLESHETYEYRFSSPEINLLNINNGKITTLEKRFGEQLPFDVDDIRYINQITDESIFIFTQKGSKGFLYHADKGFELIDLPDNLGFVNGAILEKNGNLFIEGRGRIGEDKWAIYIINRNGEILVQQETDLAVQLKKGDESYWVGLFGPKIDDGAHNIEAYHLLDATFSQKERVYLGFEKYVDFTKWNANEKLLWLKNGTTLKATKSSGEIVYEWEDKFDLAEVPMLFDGKTTWFSNRREGLVAITLEPNYFDTHRFLEKDFSNSTRGIFVSEEDEIFASTINGIQRFDPKNKTYTTRPVKDMIFTRLMEDKAGGLWSMTANGLSCYDLETRKNKSYTINRRFYPWAMYEAEDGIVWLCGDEEIFSFNTKTGGISVLAQFPNDASREFQIYEFMKSADGTVWLCSNRGLFQVDANGKYLAHYGNDQPKEFYLPANDFHHMYQDKEGIFWLATGDAGMIKWNLENQLGDSTITKRYTTLDGLSSNALHAIYEDDFGYLWISSDNGLMQFDKENEHVFKYMKENGIRHNEFNRIAHFQGKNGRLYFGGINGLTSFHPKNFSESRNQKNAAPLVISNYSQYSKKKEAFEDLTFDIINTKKITLKPGSRFFNLNLALLNFKGDNQTTYSYRIKGVYDWQTTRNQNLNISGLPYGRHTLELKAQDENQQDAANELAIKVHVLRPFYLQYWFVALVLVILGTSIFLILKWWARQLVIMKEAEQLRNLDSMKSRFFANISHELRTPITLILAPLEQFIKKNTLSEKQEQQLLSIQSNGKNLLNLVNEILDLSKLEAGKLKLNTTPVRIPQFIERIVANFESAALFQEMEYQFKSFLPKDIVADFDKPKLESIFNNLLINALKFTPKNGTIQVVLTQAENHLLIQVKDSGRGIPEDDLPYIFDRYFQSSNNLEGGTGIGLALTQELVELMGGTITVDSSMGEGTVFKLNLPISYSNEIMTEDESEIVPASKRIGIYEAMETPLVKKETILLVEDNLSLQRFVKSILIPFYNVKIVSNGKEALNQLEGSQGIKPLVPNLILSDVMMPEMDGFTFLDKVKASDKFCSIPFVLLTARADMKDKLHGLRIGVDDYMTKPFEVEELLLRIRNLLSNAKARKEPGKEDTNEQETPNQNSENTKNKPLKSDLIWLSKVEEIAKREVNNKQFTLDDMSKELLISQRNMSRKIKGITGLSPNRYIRTIRLEMARRILETQDVQTLKEVSYAVGFENTTYFSKQFENHFGKHPSTLLQKNS